MNKKQKKSVLGQNDAACINIFITLLLAVDVEGKTCKQEKAFSVVRGVHRILSIYDLQK